MDPAHGLPLATLLKGPVVRNMTTNILQGDCRTVLATLPDASVHCCVTSPPYWGLRDYGTASWEGGDVGCDHRKPPNGSDPAKGSSLEGGKSTVGHSQSWGDICRKCGARRIDQQLGLEKTPEEYVARMVEVFREVRRVLRDDGTLWLNLGDSYNGYMANQRATSISANNQEARPMLESGRGKRTAGLTAKDLVGIPWRVAFALQTDGWILRQDIIWSKPGPMPESVRDRYTKSHEYIFLLSKSQRYYFDQEAIKEPCTYPRGGACFGKIEKDGPGSRRISDADNARIRGGTRNKRSVWTVTTKPYKGAHFATFPPKLIEPCILAGCPAGGTVLDPFMGSGTTLAVAKEHGRSGIGIELNPDYIVLARRRIAAVQPSLLYS